MKRFLRALSRGASVRYLPRRRGAKRITVAASLRRDWIQVGEDIRRAIDKILRA